MGRKPRPANNIANGYINIAKFWVNVKKTDGCWFWQSRATSAGHYKTYGLFRVHVMSPRGPADRLESAHRLSYELVNGPIPPGLYVLHSCDNGLCVNPAHLRVGTHEDNMQDMILRGRTWRGGRQPKPGHNGSAEKAAGVGLVRKLTDKDVRVMREAYASDESLGLSAVARRYGIHRYTARSILLGEARAQAGGPMGAIRPHPVRPVCAPQISQTARAGSAHWSSTLSDEQIREARAAYAVDASVTVSTLARRYGLSKPGLIAILTGRSRPDAGGPISAIRRIHGDGITGAKLTDEKVAMIRGRYVAGPETIYDLGLAFGISPKTVSKIIRGATWKHVAPMPPGQIRPGHRKLTREQVTKIRQRHARGVTQARLAQDYQVSRAAICFVVNRKTHPV